MKRVLLVIVVLGVFVVSLPAQKSRITEDKDIPLIEAPTDGNFKAGALVGIVSGITAGYRFSNWFEINAIGGWSWHHKETGVLGLNGCITLVQFKAGDDVVLPLTLGPQVIFVVGEKIIIEAMANLRLEYTFSEIPLNIFAEGGGGVRLFGDSWIAWHGALGARYVF